MYEFVKLATRKYPDIHQLHTLYVEKKSGIVYVEDGTPLFDSSFFCRKSFRQSDWWIVKKYVEYWDRFFSNLTLDQETMDVIKEIIEERNEVMSNRIENVLKNIDGQISKDLNEMKWNFDGKELIITLSSTKQIKN